MSRRNNVYSECPECGYDNKKLRQICPNPNCRARLIIDNNGHPRPHISKQKKGNCVFSYR